VAVKHCIAEYPWWLMKFISHAIQPPSLSMESGSVKGQCLLEALKYEELLMGRQ